MIKNEIAEGVVNFVDHDTLRKIIYSVLDDVSAVKSTLGPAGTTYLIHDTNGITPIMTQSKDGYRIVSDMHYNDFFFDSILQIIKDVSAHNNTQIGDGTTSAEVILRYFYETLEPLVEYHKKAFSKVSRTGVVNILETLKTVIKEFLNDKGYIIPLDKFSIDDKMKILAKVATIAANNDITVGNYVAEIFRDAIKAGYDDLDVDIEENFGSGVFRTDEIGFHMNHGFENNNFATKADKSAAIYEQPRILLLNGPVIDNDTNNILEIVSYVTKTLHKPLVIVAGEYSPKITEMLTKMHLGLYYEKVPVTSYVNGQPVESVNTVKWDPVDVCCVTTGFQDPKAQMRFSDMSVSLGGIVVPSIDKVWEDYGSSDGFDALLGSADKIIITETDTSIIHGHGSKEAIDNLVEKLKGELADVGTINDDTYTAVKRSELKSRINTLQTSTVKILVGGVTMKERKYNKLVYEDAVYAIKSTMQNGFTLAGQVSLRDLVRRYRKDIIEDTVKKLTEQGRNVAFGTNREETVKDAVGMVLDVIGRTCCAAYSIALKNAMVKDSEVKKVFKLIDKHTKQYGELCTYNLVADNLEYLDDVNPENIDRCNMLVAGNTDYETFSGIADICSILLNYDKLESIYVPVISKQKPLVTKSSKSTFGRMLEALEHKRANDKALSM